VNSGFLLDVLHALVHFQGFSDRLASFWANSVELDTAQTNKQDQKQM
jgi:hypothetical protein